MGHNKASGVGRRVRRSRGSRSWRVEECASSRSNPIGGGGSEHGIGGSSGQSLTGVIDGQQTALPKCQRMCSFTLDVQDSGRQRVRRRSSRGRRGGRLGRARLGTNGSCWKRTSSGEHRRRNAVLR